MHALVRNLLQELLSYFIWKLLEITLGIKEVPFIGFILSLMINHFVSVKRLTACIVVAGQLAEADDVSYNSIAALQIYRCHSPFLV